MSPLRVTRPDLGLSLWVAISDGHRRGLVRAVDLKTGVVTLSDRGLAAVTDAAARATGRRS